jgi:hypothetical protein
MRYVGSRCLPIVEYCAQTVRIYKRGQHVRLLASILILKKRAENVGSCLTIKRVYKSDF